MLLKVSQGLQETTTVLEFIVKFILKFIFKSILQVYFTEDLRMTASAEGFLIFWKVSLLVAVHPFLFDLFSIDLLIFFGMFLVMREMIFCLMIFNTLSYYCYLSS